MGATPAQIPFVLGDAGGLPGPGPAWVLGAGARGSRATDSGPFPRWWGQQAPVPPMPATSTSSLPPGFQKLLRGKGGALLHFLQARLILQGVTGCPSQTCAQGPLGKVEEVVPCPPNLLYRAPYLLKTIRSR